MSNERYRLSSTPQSARPPALHGLRSLQFKASLWIVLLILSVSVAIMSLSLQATRTAMLETEANRTRQLAACLATSEAREVAAQDREALLKSANSIVRTQCIAYVAFAQKDGRVLASAESCAGLLAGATTGTGADTRLRLRLLDKLEPKGKGRQNIPCLEVTVPVLNPSELRADAAPRAPIGYLCVAMDITDTQSRLNGIAGELGRIAIGILLLVVPCSLLATRRIVAPLRELAQAAHAIARGSLNARAPVYSRDEIGQLARTFNSMADQVARTQSDLLELNADLERRVAQRTRDLQEQAARDPLTGLYNRRYFGEVITREFAAAERYGSDLTCLMFDVDRFKDINDRYGHRMGDKVLIALGESISAELRTADVAARFGGDEFILLLPQTAADQAAVLADRIVARFAEHVAESAPGVTATLSIGVASLRTTRSRSSEALIHEADVALYAAKEGGRNRTMQAVGAA
jgi:diguanylate cyclase (GGDEF)-like protein